MLCSPTINFRCGTKSNNLPRHTSGPTLPSLTTHVIFPKTFLRPRVQLSSHTQSMRLSRDVHGLPHHHVTPEIFQISQLLALIPLVRVHSGFWHDPPCPRAGALLGLRPTRAQPTKASRLTQPKRLVCWVRTTPHYMLCSPTINFDVGLNLTISNQKNLKVTFTVKRCGIVFCSKGKT